IITVNSTGSLKKYLEPGMLAVPDDFISFSATPTICRGGTAIHIVPALSAKMRTALLAAARDCGISVHDGGVYWQTPGPRFETRAEIAMMSQFADLVGMTMASEAVVANELGLEYAAICSVDNYANGLVEKELTLEEVLAHARRSAQTMTRIVKNLIERREG
ncbi:MAG: MTAP family purine nucleoside phosphorylase, partial [Syntrophaceae bacterium]